MKTNPRRIGRIGNPYGGLSVKAKDGKYYWSIESFTGNIWDEISKELFDALVAHEDSLPPDTTT